MARARGANSAYAFAFESSFGVPPDVDDAAWRRVPFVSSNLGEEQGKLSSDLLGYGREPQDPTDDVANNEGDVVVPVDVRNFGYWLKLLFGDPVTANAVAATGGWTFSAQPAADSTITVNGTAFTFKASGASGNEVDLGVNLAATMTALAVVLNASVVAGVATATYVATATGINVTYDTQGLAGNAFTLAAGAGSNATVSGATLEGGAVSHTFASGAIELPSASGEVGFPEIPSYGVNFGGRANSLRIALSRSGLLNATIGMIFQGEEPYSASQAYSDLDDLPQLAVERFAQATGAIEVDDVQLASVVGADFSYMNNLDKVETIRPDGRIEDADPGAVTAAANLTTRFANTDLLDLASGDEPAKVTFGWSINASKSLLITLHRTFLPRVKRPVQGPGGIQASFNCQAAIDPTEEVSVTVVLVNDVANYD